ncbi:MAG: hypothetical protein JSS02_16695 [Planctomycetes bacterium]|nr:hypothetical protein [Planctomycetota bacterium]
MLLRKILVVVCVLGGWSSTGLAQVKLVQKVAESTTKRTEVVSRTTQKLTIAGMEIDTESDSRTTVKTTAGKRDDSGNVQVQSNVENLQINLKVQGSDYVFDSANPDKATGSAFEILRPLHRGTLRRTTTTTFNNENRVSRIEFDQDPLNDIPDETRKMFQKQFDVEVLKETANQELDRLPTDPVKVGETWDRTSKMNLEGGQIMTLVTRYKYTGTIERDGKKYEKIESEVQSVDYTLGPDSTLPFTLKNSSLKPKDSKGEMLLDRERGEIVYSQATIQIVGDMTFVINNQDLPAKLDLKIESSSQPKN